MNERSGVTGFPTGLPGADAALVGAAADNGGRRRDPDEGAELTAGGPAAWASVPTSKHPVISRAIAVAAESGRATPGSPVVATPGVTLGGHDAVSATAGTPTGSTATPSTASSPPISPGVGGTYGSFRMPTLPDLSAGLGADVPVPRTAAGLAALGELPIRPGGSRSTSAAGLPLAVPAHRGRRAAPEPTEPRSLVHRPAAGSALWDEDAIRQFRAAWHEVKAEFVDDPARALTRANELLTSAVNELTQALVAERDELDPLRGAASPDTESMRIAMRRYRDFLDRILAL